MTYFICEAQELVAEVDSMDASSLYVSIVVGGKYDSTCLFPHVFPIRMFGKMLNTAFPAILIGEMSFSGSISPSTLHLSA